jgi:hypothetical protein
VVALRAETGELVWSFQTTHHDVWDYDLPAQPTLARIDTGEGMRDVVIQPTKQGFVFVLDRDTGKRYGRSRSAAFRKGPPKASNFRRRSRFRPTCRRWRRSRFRPRTYSGRFPFSAARPARNASQRCAMKASTRRLRRRER